MSHRVHSEKKLADSLLRSGIFSSNLCPFGRIRQVQNTTSCQDFGTINMNLIRISTMPEGTVQKKTFSTNQKRPRTDSNLLCNARWNLCFARLLIHRLFAVFTTVTFQVDPLAEATRQWQARGREAESIGTRAAGAGALCGWLLRIF